MLHDTDMKGILDYFLLNGHISQKRYELEEKLTSQLVKDSSSPTVSYTASIINSHPIVVTHSEYAKQAVENSTFLNQKVGELQHPIGTPKENILSPNRKLVHIGLAGILHDVKGISILEDLLASGQLNNTKVHVFGYDFATSKSRLASIMEYSNVELTVNLSDHEFQERLANLDILLNYRPYYHGEASRATLEAMRFGVVPIVRDIGWFSELPDEAAIKVNKIEELPEAVSQLIGNSELRKNMARAAVELTHSDCRADTYIQDMLNLDSASKLENVTQLAKRGAVKPSSLINLFKEVIERR